MISVAIDLGGTNIKSAVIDRERGILSRNSVPTNASDGPQVVLDRIAEAVKISVEKAPSQAVGVGIGAPGVISLDRTTVSWPPNLPGWEVINLKDELLQRTGLNAIVENDANLMALGSSRFGAGRDYDNMIMITLGTGVGGGIIFNRELFRGETGGAAELGHVIIDHNGPVSRSKARGAIETFIGQRYLVNNALPLLEKHTENPLSRKFLDKPDELEPLHLSEEAAAGNKLARDILAEAGRMLGYAIVNYVHILDIRKIMVSGGVAGAGEFILGPAREAVQERMMPPYLEGFELRYESLGNDAALLGAGALAFEQLPRH